MVGYRVFEVQGWLGTGFGKYRVGRLTGWWGTGSVAYTHMTLTTKRIV